MRHRPSLLLIATILSAALCATVVVFWIRSYQDAGQIKRTRVRESAEAYVVVDAYSGQAWNGVVWVGRARTKLGAIPYFPLKITGDRARIEAAASNLAILTLLDDVRPAPSTVLGAGVVSGVVVKSQGIAELESELEGVVVPCWLLVAVTLVLPVVWLSRRICLSRELRPE